MDSNLPDALAKDAVIADATAAHVVGESGAHHAPANSHCLNCATPLQGSYCHQCGQHDFDFHRSFWHVFLEALENFLHFDTKLFRNIYTLLFRPGRLSAEFNTGKRAAQMPPFRLYVFTAFVFFVVIFAGEKSAELKPQGKSPREELSERRSKIVSTSKREAIAYTPKAASDEAAKTSEEKSEFVRWLEERGQNAYEHQPEFAHAVLHSIPKVMLFCMPLFALLTRILWRKSGLVYLQHLVIALHFHTFIYLWMLFTRGWTALAELPGWTVLAAIIAFSGHLWIAIYPIVMLRTLFGNSWKKTFFKTCLLAGAYWFTLVAGFIAVAAAYFALL
ncbi:DUF3667 domain-containing protein [Oleiharenicola lentus]|uniref:DUF3667 domain-containing protein n=1 Tax=Oleiharenicola lentus TaxID=2508720 RepID=UPI003F66B355